MYKLIADAIAAIATIVHGSAVPAVTGSQFRRMALNLANIVTDLPAYAAAAGPVPSTTLRLAAPVAGATQAATSRCRILNIAYALIPSGAASALILVEYDYGLGFSEAVRAEVAATGVGTKGMMSFVIPPDATWRYSLGGAVGTTETFAGYYLTNL